MKLVSMAAMAVLALGSTTALAQFSATVAATTDYDFRGVTQTDEDPALQASVDFEHEQGFYAGAWASKVDFLDCCNENVEVDWYAGYAWDYRDVSFDVGYNLYSYPGADDLDYGEFYVGAAYGDGELYYWYTDDFFGLGESAFYLEGNYSIALPEEFSLDLHVGYTAGDGLEAVVESGLQEYIDYAIAVSRSFGHIDGEIRYVDTDLPREFEVGSRVIVSISTTFPWSDD